VQGLRRHLSESGSAFRSVARNRDLRLLSLALTGSCVGHWSYVVAVSVYAYHAGGARAVAVVWLVRMIPAAIVSPFSSLLGDRFPRVVVLVATDLVRASLMVAAAVAIWADAPQAVVFGLAALVSLAATPAEPAFAGLMPQLATTPAELTAANVASSAIQSVGFFAGPALGAIVLAVAGPPAAIVVTAGLVLWSAVLTSRIRRIPAAAARFDARAVVDEVGAGFRAIRRDRMLTPLVGLLTATTLVDGALEVFVVVISLETIGAGNAGVGYLNAAFGVGALAGALLSTLLVGTRRLSIPFVAGVVLWGAPIALLAAVSMPAAAIALLALVGLGNTFFDVAGTTLVQRAVPDEVLSRVFGVMQSLWLAAIGVGAAIAPALISAFGIRPALVATGLFLPALVLLVGRRLMHIDAQAAAPERTRIELLQGMSLFAPLPTITLEQLALRLVPVEFRAGDVLIREGDPGDRFIAIATGTVDVTTGGRFVASLGPGDYVGEIALLKDVPRTATVTARSPLHGFALDRAHFLAALSGSSTATRIADETIGSRLAGLRRAQRKSRFGV
jgi:MFS family permease